jgi:hypothetical protein
MAGSYALIGEKEKAIKYFKEYLDNLQRPSLWIISSVENEPLFESIKNDTGFQQIVRNLESKYQEQHEKVRKWLEEQSML